MRIDLKGLASIIQGLLYLTKVEADLRQICIEIWGRCNPPHDFMSLQQGVGVFSCLLEHLEEIHPGAQIVWIQQ